MQLLKTAKAVGWPERLKAMEVGQTLPVALKNAASARQAISRSLPNSGVTMEFETETMTKVIKGKNVKYVEIRRTA